MKLNLVPIKCAASAAVVLALVFSSQSVAVAQHRGGGEGNRSSGSSGGQRFSAQRNGGGSFRQSTPRESFSGQRGYAGGERGFSERRDFDRGGYYRSYGGRSGIYFGFGGGYPYAPGYGYDPGYPYDPSYYYGQSPVAPPCSEGAYDRNGNWIPNPDCYVNQQQYQSAPPNYGVNPQQNSDPRTYNPQYLPPGQGYYPNQQAYPPQQTYDPNRRQPYNQ
jgi:hypothetical protein